MDVDAVPALLDDTCQRFAVPGAQVGLLVGDERIVVCRGTVGTEASPPVTPTTAFHAGSIAKALAALVVVDAARRGDLDLDQPCADQAPGLWPDTPRSLMGHTSGRANELPGTDEDLHHFVERIGALPLVHEPGRFSYSNAGWSVLDALLQARTGASFETLAAQRILRRPLRFTVPDDAAAGHAVGPGTPIQTVPPVYAASAAAAGATWWSTADELLDLAALLLDLDAVADLDPADVAELHRRHVSVPGATVADGWGLGLALWDRPGHRAFGWAGFTGGHRSYLRCFPDEGAAIVVLTNSAGPLFGPPGGSALFDAILPDLLAVVGVSPLPPPDRPGPGTPVTELAGTFGPVGSEPAGADSLLVHAAAFGSAEPLTYERAGGDAFELVGRPPGGTAIAFDRDLLYVGPFALPRTDTR